jgi:hypothetical protein
MGQPKTPGTMLQNGYTDANVNKVLAAGTHPWTILPIPHWFGKGCFHRTSPAAQPPGSDAAKGEFRMGYDFQGLPLIMLKGG